MRFARKARFSDMRFLRLLLFAAASGLPVCVFAETPPRATITGVEAYSHVVARLETAIPFYRDVLGLEILEPPTDFHNDPEMNELAATPRALSRHVRFRLPGSSIALQLIEYKNIDRRPPARPRYQDPGVTCLVLFVRDVDIFVSNLKQANARLITTGGQVVALKSPNSTARVIFAEDPDGFYIGLSQRTPVPVNTAPAESRIVGASLEFMIGDMDQTMNVYRDVLGLPYPPSSFERRETINAGADTPQAQTRRTQAPIPGMPNNSNFPFLIFLEYKGVDRTPLMTRIQDPGASVLRLRVTYLESAAKDLKTTGLAVSSRSVKTMKIGATRAFLFRDPNGVFVDLVEYPSPSN